MTAPRSHPIRYNGSCSTYSQISENHEPVLLRCQWRTHWQRARSAEMQLSPACQCGNCATRARVRVDLHLRSGRSTRVRGVRILAAIDHCAVDTARAETDNSHHLHTR